MPTSRPRPTSCAGRRDTVRVRLYVGEQFRWAYLRNGNLGDGLLTRAGYREKFFREHALRARRLGAAAGAHSDRSRKPGLPLCHRRAGFGAPRRARHCRARGAASAGRVVVFDSLQIVGNTKTKKRFLTKYLQIFPGQPFSQQRVAAAAQLLRQLPYVKLRAEPEVRFAQGRARVYLLLDDRPSNQFDAIVGILPNANASQTGVQFTGDVTINLRNIKGGGKQVGLQWRKTDALSQLLDAQYVHPNFFGTPLEVAATFNLYKQTDAFLTLRPRVQVTLPHGAGGPRQLLFRAAQLVLLLDSAAVRQLRQLPENIDSQYNSYGLAYAWNSLDDLFFPHRGYLLNVQGGGGHQNHQPKRRAAARALRRLAAALHAVLARRCGPSATSR